MKVMVLVKATKESEAGVMPGEQLLAEMGKFNEELAQAGIMLAGDGLHPSSKGARVRFSGKDRAVIPGPFAQFNELVAGFWLWQVKSMDEAIEWVKRCPNPMPGESEIEIRRVFSAEDFGEAFTPKLQQQESRIRAAIESYQLDPPRFETAREITVAGLNESYTMDNRGGIPAQWHKFAQYLGKVPGQIGGISYGVSWNHKPPQNFDYLTGVEVRGAETMPMGFAQVRLLPGRYAVFTHHKPISEFPKTMGAIWSHWLPNSGHKLADAPVYERYGEDFDPQTGQGVEIWVPLKS